MGLDTRLKREFLRVYYCPTSKEENIEPDHEQPFRVDTIYFSVSSQLGSFAGIYWKLGILARSDREHQIGPSQPSDKSKSVIILDLK